MGLGSSRAVLSDRDGVQGARLRCWLVDGALRSSVAVSRAVEGVEATVTFRPLRPFLGSYCCAVQLFSFILVIALVSL